MEIKFKLVKNEEIDEKIGEVWQKLNPVEKGLLKQRVCELIIAEENFIRGVDSLLKELEERNKPEEVTEEPKEQDVNVAKYEEDVEEVNLDKAKTVNQPKKFVVRPKTEITM